MNTKQGFEAWALSNGFNIKLAYDGTYLFPVTQAAFMGYQAAQKAAFSAWLKYAFNRTSKGFNGECVNDHLADEWKFKHRHLDDLPDAGKEMLDAGINEFIQAQK